MTKIVFSILLLLISISSAGAAGCAAKSTVEACVACIKQQGLAGGTGGYRYCSENVGKQAPKKKKS